MENYFIISVGFIGLAILLYFFSQRQQGRTVTLELYAKDLTALARRGELDPVIGRNDEIHRVIQILSRRTKNNPVLIGKSGVGKTAIVEGLANEIASGNVPETIKGKRVLALDLAGLVAGTKYRGEFERRMKMLTDEIIKSQRSIILFIDELHTLAEAGEASGAIDAADILKPALARGELQVVGASTPEDYAQYISHDLTLERRFQPVAIEEPTAAETKKILQGLRPRYETFHKIRITDEAISLAVTLSEQKLTDRHLPDKAIDIIDEAAAKVHLDNLGKTQKHRPVVTEDVIKQIIHEWESEVKIESQFAPLNRPPSDLTPSDPEQKNPEKGRQTN